MRNPAQGESSPPPHRPPSAGPKTMTDLLALADPERSLLNWLVRQRRASLADMIAHTQADPAAVQAMVDGLIRDGFLIPLEEGARVEGTQVEDSSVMFKPNLLSRKPRTVPDQIWKALD